MSKFEKEAKKWIYNGGGGLEVEKGNEKALSMSFWGLTFMMAEYAELKVAEEREACARAAEGVVPRHIECGNKIAAAIRSRK